MQTFSPGWDSNASNLDTFTDVRESGKLTPHIDRTYPLSDVPEAIRYLQDGHAKGKRFVFVHTLQVEFLV